MSRRKPRFKRPRPTDAQLVRQRWTLLRTRATLTDKHQSGRRRTRRAYIMWHGKKRDASVLPSGLVKVSGVSGTVEPRQLAVFR